MGEFSLVFFTIIDCLDYSIYYVPCQALLASSCHFFLNLFLFLLRYIPQKFFQIMFLCGEFPETSYAKISFSFHLNKFISCV